MITHKHKSRRRWLFIFMCSIGFTSAFYFLLMSWHTSSTQYHYMRNRWRKLNWNLTKVTDEEEARLVDKKYPNIPFEYWLKVKNVQSEMFYENKSCALFPDINNLEISNEYWQTINLANETTVQMYSAFYDTRQTTPGISVKILGMVNRTSNVFPGKRELFCQLWFSDQNEPVISKIDQVFYIWYDYWQIHKDGKYGPYLMNCPIPESHLKEVPKVVSLVEKPCDNTRNLLKVVYNLPEEQKNFSVCVKGLDFLQVDLSLRLVEWIELILNMGVDKIYFYELNVHPNVKKVLEYYVKMGKVDVTKTSLPAGNPNVPIIQHMFMERESSVKTLTEIIPYNDCFYRNIYNNKYVVLIDIDEIIVPRQDKDWNGLMSRVLSHITPGKRYASFNARNVYFLDAMVPDGEYPNVPPYMHMLQHVYRSKNFTKPGWYVKSFFVTNETISCHNHLPVSHAKGSHISYNIDIKDGYMQHYRHSCAPELKCDDYVKDPVKDDRLWEFKDVIIKRVNKALEDFDFLSPG